MRTAEIHRTYRYQFLNKLGTFQKYWLTGTDTAYSIHFTIVNGSGYHRNFRVARHMTSLSGEWMITGTNTNTITLNTVNDAPYRCSGIDTVTTEHAKRTMNYTLMLTFTNVTGPRGSRLDVAEKTSGTLSGTYHATVTFLRGSAYSERTVDRTFTITLGGDGQEIHLGDRRFPCDGRTGELMP